MGVLAGVIGWVVTDVSCRQNGEPCTGWTLLFSGLAFVAVTIGVALVLSLVYRSLAEWKTHNTD